MDDLQEVFNAHPIGLAAFSKKVGQPKSKLRAFYDGQEIAQINRQPKPRGLFKITAPADTWQIDVMHMPYKSRGIDKVLLFVEVTARVAHAIPLRNMQAGTILDAIKEFHQKYGIHRLEGDNQFAFKDLAEYAEAEHFDVVTGVADEEHISHGNRLGMVDSFTKTLKRRIRNYLLVHGTRDFITPLQSIIEDYNNTVHSRTRDTPNAIYNDTEKMTALQFDAERHNIKISKLYNFQPGDQVRVIVAKSRFEKEGPRFSRELHRVVDQKGYRYHVEGFRSLFKPWELLPAPAATAKLPADRVVAAVRAARMSERLAREGLDSANVIRPTRGSRRTG